MSSHRAKLLSMSSATLRERLQPLIPLIFSSQTVPVLHWLIASDGRVTRHTLRGDFPDVVLEPHVMSQLAAFVNDLRKGRTIFTEHDTGLVFGGVWNADGSGQLRLVTTPDHAWRMEDWDAALSPVVFRYLQAAVAAGHNLWIVGDTGVETELAAALCSRSTLARMDGHRPAPKNAIALPLDTTLAAALQAQRQGGFEHLLWCGEVTPEVVLALEAHSGVVLVQRSQSPDWALQRSGLAERPDVASSLSALAAVVKVQRSVAGAVLVANVAEFRAREGGLDLAIIAERDRPDTLAFTSAPQLASALVAAGAVRMSEGLPRGDVYGEAVAEDFQASEDLEATEADVDDIDIEPADAVQVRAPRSPRGVDARGAATRGAASIRQSLQRSHRQRSLEEDPGWELDALGEGGALISAPGEAGQGGLMRARPLLRPSAPAGVAEADDSGALTLDAPHRIIIPEAPSGSRGKKTFAEIMKERHRYPPMSSDGTPTLTPPVITELTEGFAKTQDDDDIVPQD